MGFPARKGLDLRARLEGYPPQFMTTSSKVSDIERCIASADPVTAEDMLPALYGELREIAQIQLRRDKNYHSVEPTELVHEACTRIITNTNGAGEDTRTWNDRAHFLATAAVAMRNILIDRARARSSAKRGGSAKRVDLSGVDHTLEEMDEGEQLALHEALERLAVASPKHAEVVNLRFFGELSLKEVAVLMGISEATAARHWSFARAWLLSALEDEV